MPSDVNIDFSPLEQAVSTWNGHFLGTYGGLMRQLSEATEKLQLLYAQVHNMEPLALPDMIHLHGLDNLENKDCNAIIQGLSGQMEALDTSYESLLKAVPEFEEQLQQLSQLMESWKEQLVGLVPEQEPSTLPDDKRRILHGELSSARDQLAALDGEKKAKLEIVPMGADDEPAADRKQPLGALLVASGLITEKQLKLALQEQESSWHRHLGAIMVEKHFASEEDIARTLAQQLSLPYSDLEREDIRPSAIAVLPGKLVFRHTCIPLRFEGHYLLVAMANPLDLLALEDIALISQRTVKPIISSARKINLAIRSHYPAIL